MGSDGARNAGLSQLIERERERPLSSSEQQQHKIPGRLPVPRQNPGVGSAQAWRRTGGVWIRDLSATIAQWMVGELWKGGWGVGAPSRETHPVSLANTHVPVVRQLWISLFDF